MLEGGHMEAGFAAAPMFQVASKHPTRRATHMHNRPCTSDMTVFIPQLLGGEANKIFKVDLLNTLNKMHIKMDLEEFDKLWTKFDLVNSGFIKSDEFLKRLGVAEESPNKSLLESSNEFAALESDRENNRSMSIPIANVDESKTNDIWIVA